MKRWGVGLAVVGAAGMVLAGVSPAEAKVDRTATSVSAAPAQPVFVKRYFNCYYDEGCFATAVLPKTWRAIRLGTDEYRFADPTAPRMIRIRMNIVNGPSTAVAAKRKQAALKGTRGLKILSRKSTTMKSTSGQGPLTVTTLVYTYRSGSTTRYVATRYIAMWSLSTANVEMTVGGRLKDRAVLTKVLDKATTSITLAG